MRDLKDKVIVITGAASGIGRALALCLAREGSALAVSDIHREGLLETAAMIEGTVPRVTTHVLDVADRALVYRTAGEIYALHGQVDVIINNAGTAIAESLEDVTYRDFERIMDVNFWGVVYGTKAFLPYLKQRPQGHIVNISSIDGILSFPCSGPYCVSKFAVRAFTEGLFQELRGTDVTVTCVIPGGIRTAIHRNARFFKTADPLMTREESIAYLEKAAMTSAEKAARIIVKGIKRNKSRILIGPDARIMELIHRVSPLGATIGIAHIMKNLKWGALGLFRRESSAPAASCQSEETVCSPTASWGPTTEAARGFPESTKNGRDTPQKGKRGYPVRSE